MLPPDRWKMGALPNARSEARAAAPTAGWSSGVMAGQPLDRLLTDTVTVDGAMARRWSIICRSMTRGSWSGTSRVLILAAAQPGMIVLGPSPW